MSGSTLVTGAAGFAGGHLIDLLAGSGSEVVGWHRPGRAAPPRAGVRWQAVDLLDPLAVKAATRALAPARVFHCAGAAHVGQAWDQTTSTLATNVLGTHHLVEALRESAPEARVLIVSSALVYAPRDTAIREEDAAVPASPYGLSKLAQEMVGTGNTGGPGVWVARPFNHFGPRQDPSFVTAGFAQRIAAIEAGHAPAVLAVGNIEPRRDLTDVRDTVRAYATILERGVPGRPYNVCTGRAHAIREILDLMLAKARVPIRILTDPARYRPNDLPLVLGDPGRIHRELGWTPAIPMEQTLEDLLTYWRARASVR